MDSNKKPDETTRVDPFEFGVMIAFSLIRETLEKSGQVDIDAMDKEAKRLIDIIRRNNKDHQKINIALMALTSNTKAYKNLGV